MPKKKLKTQPKDILLTVVFVFIILIGFVGVWYVAEYTNGQNVEIVYESDSDTDYTVLKWLNSAEFTTFQTASYIPSLEWQFNRTPAYIGNNTWGMSVNESAVGVQHQVVFAMPHMKNWVIDEIILNITNNDDTDMRIGLTAYSTATAGIGDSSAGTVILLDNTAGGSALYYNETIDVPLVTALDIYDHANNHPVTILVLFWDDLSGDGMSAFSPQWKITITGEKQSTWSMNNKLALVVGFADFMLVIGIIYIQDQFDLFGYVKDLPTTKKKR